VEPAEIIGAIGFEKYAFVVIAAIAWQLIYLLRRFGEKKLNGRLEPTDYTKRGAVHACAWSPDKAKEWGDVVESVRKLREYNETQAREIASGKFACHFKDHDEVRDMLDLLRNINTGISRLDATLQDVARQARS